MWGWLELNIQLSDWSGGLTPNWIFNPVADRLGQLECKFSDRLIRIVRMVRWWADRVGEMNILMLWKSGPKNAGQNSCAFQWANWMILTSAFLTGYHNLSILTIPISLSNISDKSTVQQFENSDNQTAWESNNSDSSDSLIIWQSDHSNNSDEPIQHFGQINCLTIQHFQQSDSLGIRESDHSSNSD